MPRASVLYSLHPDHILEGTRLIIWDGERKLLKGNTHMHTTLSDGRLSPEDACALYARNGYDFVVITDHRKVSTPTGTLGGLLAVQGIELDYSLNGQVVHLVGVGVPENIMDKAQRIFSAQRGVDEINASGGAAILAHPAWSLNTVDVIASFHGLCGAEVYNTVSAMPWNVDRADSSNILDCCAANGCLLNFLAADDAHAYKGDECKSYIMLAAKECTEAAIVAALRAGDFYATQGPRFESVTLEGDTLRVRCSPVRAIVFPSDLTWGAKRVLTGDSLTEGEYAINRERFQRFVRVMIVDDQGRRAWTSPVSLY